MTIEQINPEVREVNIGTRKMEVLKIYPLSIGELFTLTGLIKKTLQTVTFLSDKDGEVTDSEDVKDLEVITSVIEGVRENLASILSLISDEDGNELMMKMTTNQTLEVSEIIFDMNFSETSEKLKGLVEKVRKAFGGIIPNLPDPEGEGQ